MSEHGSCDSHRIRMEDPYGEVHLWAHVWRKSSKLAFPLTFLMQKSPPTTAARGDFYITSIEISWAYPQAGS